MSDAFRVLLVIGLAWTVACGDSPDKTAVVSAEKPAAVVQRPAGPSNWSEINSEAIRLFREGRRADSTAMYKKVVDTFPDFADAHFSLATNHEMQADDLRRDAAQTAARTEHLRQAAVHYTRFRELSADDPLVRGQASGFLVKIYGPDGLKEMDKAVSAGRDYVKDEPADASSYGTLAGALRAQRDYSGATDALKAAMAAAQKNARLARYLTEHVKEAPGLQPAVVQQFLTTASEIADRLTADANTGNQADGYTVKALIVEAQAAIEKDPVKKKQLLAQVDRFDQEAQKALRK